MLKICPLCLKEFNSRRSKYVCCSKSCAIKYRGIRNRQKRNTKCLHCGENFITYPYWIKRGGGKYCSWKCRDKDKRNRVKRQCQVCNKIFTVKPSSIKHSGSKYCSHKCMWVGQKGQEKPSIQGANAHNWNNGSSGERYPLTFNDVLKDKIRKCDDYACKVCGLSNEEHIILYGYNLQVHHIDYNKQNSNECNLVSLCAQCHGRTNYNRSYWTDFFNNQLIRK